MKKSTGVMVSLFLLLMLAAPNAKAATFKDISTSYSFYKEINYLVNKKIVSGYSNGMFKPNQVVTRAEAAIMIGRAKGLDGTKKKTVFSDVNASNGASGYIQSAVDAGIIQGFPDGTFRPDETVTRGQVAILVSKAFQLTKTTKVTYKDVSLSSAAYPSIGKASAVRITLGYADNTFRPNLGVTRGQFSAFLARALDPSFTKNMADALKTVQGNKQLILVTAGSYGTSSAKIQTFERNDAGYWIPVLNVPGYIGKNGFAKTKAEGDGKTPRGKYTIGTAFGTKGNPGTKLPFRNITSDDVWVDDPNSKLYNTWQSKSKTKGQWKSAENMNIPAYKYGFVINYNTERVPGKGSAIFFHISNGHTLGCTGVSEKNVVSILKWLDPDKNPVIIQTPSSELSSY